MTYFATLRRAAVTCLLLVGVTVLASRAHAQDGARIVRNGLFRAEVITEVVIDAPIEVVWDVLTDVAAYPEWNPFVLEVNPDDVDVTIPGTTLDLTVARGGRSRTAPVEVLGGTPPGSPERAEWVYHAVDLAAVWGILKAQRIHQLEPLDDGRTHLFLAETFSGLVFTAPLNATADAFDAFVEALAARCAEVVGG